MFKKKKLYYYIIIKSFAPLNKGGTYKVPNEIETKRNETKSTKTKRNEINEMKTK